MTESNLISITHLGSLSCLYIKSPLRQTKKKGRRTEKRERETEKERTGGREKKTQREEKALQHPRSSLFQGSNDALLFPFVLVLLLRPRCLHISLADGYYALLVTRCSGHTNPSWIDPRYSLLWSHKSFMDRPLLLVALVTRILYGSTPVTGYLVTQIPCGSTSVTGYFIPGYLILWLLKSLVDRPLLLDT